jgi:hypothetical protein
MSLNPSRAKEVNKSRLKVSKAKARVNLNRLSNQEPIGATIAKSLLTQRTIAATHLRMTPPLQKGEKASLLPKKESLTAEAKDGSTATFPVSTIQVPTPMQLLIPVLKHRHHKLHGIHTPHGLKMKETSDSCFSTIMIPVATFLRFQRSKTYLFLGMTMSTFLIPW